MSDPPSPAAASRAVSAARRRHVPWGADAGRAASGPLSRIQRQHLIQRRLEGDQAGTHQPGACRAHLYLGPPEQPGNGAVAIEAQSLGIGHRDQEQIQRQRLCRAVRRCWRSRTKRWSTQLNWRGTRRRRDGTNRVLCIACSSNNRRPAAENAAGIVVGMCVRCARCLFAAQNRLSLPRQTTVGFLTVSPRIDRFFAFE